MSKNIHNPLIILTGTFILMIISFYNGYPLVYSDTGTYIFSGFDKFVPVDRPIVYGLFLNLISLKTSLWFVVFVQNLLTSFIIYEICALLINKNNLPLYFVSILLFLTFFTGIGWYSNQIMPDLFTPISLLILFLLFYAPDIRLPKLSIYSSLFILSLTVHFTHLIIVILVTIVLLIIEYILKKKNFFPVQYFRKGRIILVLGLIISAWILVPTVNYLVEKKFNLSKGSHAFLMAHLADTGVLEKFLQENCNNDKYKDCKLCNYKDSIPKDLATFLWETNGVFSKTGGWNESEEEYNKIINGTLKKPRFLILNIYKSFSYGCIQLFRNEIGQGLSAYNEGSPPYGQIHWRFHSELNNYLNARQNLWNGTTLDLKTLNLFNLLLNIVSLLSLVYIFFTPLFRQINHLSLHLLIFSILSIIINAFVTAGLNAPCERFQARVVWLLPFAILIIILTNWEVLKKQMTNKETNH
jgi:hypothetical protein